MKSGQLKELKRKIAEKVPGANFDFQTGRKHHTLVVTAPKGFEFRVLVSLGTKVSPWTMVLAVTDVTRAYREHTS